MHRAMHMAEGRFGDSRHRPCGGGEAAARLGEPGEPGGRGLATGGDPGVAAWAIPSLLGMCLANPKKSSEENVITKSDPSCAP